MNEQECKKFERYAAGVPFDGPEATGRWLETLTQEERAIAESLYRRMAARLKVEHHDLQSPG